MTITLPCKPILSALDIASKAIVGKSLPALGMALFEVTPDGGMQVTCDSLDCRLSVTIPDLGLSSYESFLAPPRLFRAALRGEEATLSVDGQTLIVDSFGKSKLATLPVSEFPQPRQAPSLVPVDPAEFLMALKIGIASAATGTGDAKECLYYDAINNLMVAGHATGIAVTPCSLPAESFLLHRDSARVLLSVCREDDLAIGVEAGHLHFKSGNVSGSFSLVTGAYMNVKSVMLDAPKVATVDREAFVNALSSLDAFFDDTYRRTKIEQVSLMWKISCGTDANSIVLPMDGVAPLAEFKPVSFRADSVLNVIRFWECDRLLVRLDQALYLSPESEDGKMAIIMIFRQPV